MLNQLLLWKKKGNGMQFHSRRRSKKGIAGFTISLFCVVLFLVLCVLSTVAKGQAGVFVGACGLGIMALCVVAFVLCLKGLKEKDVYTTIPFVGLLVAGSMFVLFFCLYITGIKF